MADLRVEQMLTDQVEQVDPFTKARDLFNSKSSIPVDGSLMSGSLFGSTDTSLTPMGPIKNPNTIQSTSSSSTIGTLNSAPKSDFEASGLPKFLQKIGVDDKGLALNELGRFQLIGRLKKKFGPDYEKNPQALDALTSFDKEIGKFPMETQKSLNVLNSGGERTLKALLGG